MQLHLALYGSEGQARSICLHEDMKGIENVARLIVVQSTEMLEADLTFTGS
jgi:hypothetical protein